MDNATYTLRELTLRYTVRNGCDGEAIAVRESLNTPRQSAQLLMRLLQDEASEVFAILLLSTRHHVLAYHVVSRGTLDSTFVHPREVFKAAMVANAAAVILAHVHPSGDPTPTHDDVALTARLFQAGELLGIEVLDHIVVGHGRYASFKELALL